MVLKISFVAAIAGAGTGPDQQWLANLRAINKINEILFPGSQDPTRKMTPSEQLEGASLRLQIGNKRAMGS